MPVGRSQPARKRQMTAKTAAFPLAARPQILHILAVKWQGQ